MDVITATDYLVKSKMLMIYHIEEVRIGTALEEYNILFSLEGRKMGDPPSKTRAAERGRKREVAEHHDQG